MLSFADTLQRFMRGKIGSQKLSNLTEISKSKIDSWLQGTAKRPRDWRPILTIAQALLLSREEADTLLLSAGHQTIGERAEELAPDHPDRRYLQPWVEVASLSPSARHQLRVPVGDFIGRTEEIDQLQDALHKTSATDGTATIIGVLGMGGIGKTELVYSVAHKLRSSFPDAQIVLTLGGSTSMPLTPEQVLQTVIHAFTPDAKLPEDLSALETIYRSKLHNQRVLILADDARNAEQVRSLLPPAGCALLITSRQCFTLPGMITINLTPFCEDEAVTLLRVICSRLTSTEARAIAIACGYLPLALRISGSILHNDSALTVATYLQHLADERQRLSQLSDPDDTELNVEASLALSYVQMDVEAQHIFRQLGVIVADFTTELALAVVEAHAGVDVDTILHRLLRRNMIMYDETRVRWRLHDLLRDVARQRLEAMEESDAIHWRYARAAVAIAQAIQNQYLVGGDRIPLALSQFDAERTHIDTARQWAQRHAGIPDGDQMLIDVTWEIRHIQPLRYDWRHEIIPQWEGVQMAARRLGVPLTEARALSFLGNAYKILGESRTSITYYEQALAAFREIGIRRSEGIVLGNLGTVYKDLGEPRKAISYKEEALAAFRETGDRRNEGIVLANLGNGYSDLGEPLKAINYYEQGLTITREVGNRQDEGVALQNLGNTYTNLGDTNRAIECCEASLTIMRELRNKRDEGYSLSYLARAQAVRGDRADAITTFTQALVCFDTVGDRRGAAECQWLFGLALAQHGERDQAMPLLRAALAYQQEIGHVKATEHAALVASLEANEEDAFK